MSIATKCTCGFSVSGFCLPRISECKNIMPQIYIPKAQELINKEAERRYLLFTEEQKANFWVKVNQTNYCWVWGRSKNKNGYGTVRIAGKLFLAHRVSYQIINGIISDSILVLHKCDNPGCVNPGHLFIGSHQDNMTDMCKKGRSRFTGKKSKYIGVSFRNDSNKFRAFVSVRGKIVWLGSFDTQIDAAKKRDSEILKRGMLNKLNFQPHPTQSK